MRLNYYVTGPDEDFELAQQQQHVRRRRAHQGFYDDGFDPDEIFMSFVFGSPQTGFFARAHVIRTRAATATARANSSGRTHEAVGSFNLVTLADFTHLYSVFGYLFSFAVIPPVLQF